MAWSATVMVVVALGLLLAAILIPMVLVRCVRTMDVPGTLIPEMCLTSEPFCGDVDVVVTWVDSSCPEWQRLRAEASVGAGVHGDNRDVRFPPPEQGAVDAELRLCLDLVARHMPFVRRVHLVTQRPQVPSWLAAYPTVHIVHHDEIWPDARGLPSFSSVAIEACLHRIPGLAEHFLYLNDDFYVTSPVTVRHFFDVDGKPVHTAVLKDPRQRSTKGHEAIFTKQWCNVADALQCDRVYMPAHAPVPLTRSLMSRCSEDSRFRDLWERTTRAPFRSRDGIPPIGLCINVAGQMWAPDLSSHRCKYVNGDEAQKKLPKLIGAGYPDYLCICVNNCSSREQIQGVVDAFDGIGEIPTFPETCVAAQKRKLILTYTTRDAVPEKVWRALREYAAGYDVCFFDDRDCVTYIGEHYPKAFLDKYRTIQRGAHRADMFRYCVLLRDAPALYLDIKTWLVRDLDDAMPPSDTNATVLSTLTGTVHQGVLQVVRPNDTVLRDCLAHVMRTSSKTMEQDYHVFCKYMHMAICEHTASPTIAAGSHQSADGYGWTLLEERCTKGEACDSASADHKGRCCTIYDQEHTVVMHTRYPDFRKEW